MSIDFSKVEKDAKASMNGTIEFLDETFAHIRAGRANPRILDGIMLNYYGTLTPLSGIASISIPDGRTIAIQPWEKKMLTEIETAIINSDIGLNPDNNGEMIRLNIPALTEERRKELTRQVKQEAEDAKISIRNARRDAIDIVRKSIKDGLAEDIARDYENDIQKLHDQFIKKIDDMYVAKEKEVMTV